MMAKNILEENHRQIPTFLNISFFVLCIFLFRLAVGKMYHVLKDSVVSHAFLFHCLAWSYMSFPFLYIDPKGSTHLLHSALLGQNKNLSQINILSNYTAVYPQDCSITRLVN